MSQVHSSLKVKDFRLRHEDQSCFGGGVGDLPWHTPPPGDLRITRLDEIYDIGPALD